MLSLSLFSLFVEVGLGEKHQVSNSLENRTDTGIWKLLAEVLKAQASVIHAWCSSFGHLEVFCNLRFGRTITSNFIQKVQRKKSILVYFKTRERGENIFLCKHWVDRSVFVRNLTKSWLIQKVCQNTRYLVSKTCCTWLFHLY